MIELDLRNSIEEVEAEGMKGTIPASISHLKRLERLQIEGNYLLEGELPLESFKKLRALKFLNITILPLIENLDEFKRALNAALPNCLIY